LVTESGVFDDEFSTGTQAEIGNDLERFNPVSKRGKVRPETADSTAEHCGDGSHGAVRPRSMEPVQGHRDSSILAENLGMRQVASTGMA
jgi:hypothetical protein